MTDDLKAKYREHCEKREAATEGPWRSNRGFVHAADEELLVNPVDGYFYDNDDADFICHARNSDLHEKLWAEIGRLRAALEAIVGRTGGGNRGAVVVTTEMLAKIAQQGLDGY